MEEGTLFRQLISNKRLTLGDKFVLSKLGSPLPNSKLFWSSVERIIKMHALWNFVRK
jgi:hypothetical protein